VKKKRGNEGELAHLDKGRPESRKKTWAKKGRAKRGKSAAKKKKRSYMPGQNMLGSCKKRGKKEQRYLREILRRWGGERRAAGRAQGNERVRRGQRGRGKKKGSLEEERKGGIPIRDSGTSGKEGVKKQRILKREVERKGGQERAMVR